MSADTSKAQAVTHVLNQAAAGKADAAAALLPLVYDHLRQLAANRMRQQPPEHTLQATALVHEAYLRLVHDTGSRRWEDRGHFFAAAAEAMRCILIDNARRKNRLKRGGNGREAGVGALQRVDLNQCELTVADEAPDDLLALDEALNRLAEAHPEKAKLVKLRYFAGLTIEETARTLGISTATAERRWAFSRAWLFKRLYEEPRR